MCIFSVFKTVYRIFQRTVRFSVGIDDGSPAGANQLFVQAFLQIFINEAAGPVNQFLPHFDRQITVSHQPVRFNSPQTEPDQVFGKIGIAADGTAATGTPFQIFSAGVAGFLEMFGIPVYVAQCFMTMCVSALALTSLDSVARIGRMSFQELFSVDDMEHAEGWRKFLCNKYVSTIITLAFGYILTRVGYSNIWPLFGSANQLLSALVLITLCVFLKVTGRENKTLFPPLIIMLCVTFTALVERTIALVNAFGAGTAVFMVEGLQLIIAILLMVLGVIIVYTSGKELFNKKAEVKHSKEGKLA